MIAAQVPWRVGATSYVIDDDLVGNARHLADRWTGRLQDMQLVLFDLPGGPGNLPSPAAVKELAAIGERSGLGYTVHLLYDIAAVGVDAGWERALAWAHLVIARTRGLRPWAYVLHLYGRQARDGTVDRGAWTAGVTQALTLAGAWAGGISRLAVENLTGYPPDFVNETVARSGAQRCVDVGHLWLDGVNPVPWLAQAGRTLRVVHLHGVAATSASARDHTALDTVPKAALDAVVAHLLTHGFKGVLTLEVFGQVDFEASYAALMASVARVDAERRTEQLWAKG